MSSDIKRTTILVPFTLDTEREPSDASDGSTTSESDLLVGLEDAYNYGNIPSDTSWYKPIVAELPDGWRWVGNGAWTIFADDTVQPPSCQVVDGGFQTRGVVPIQVVAAVLARFAGKVGE
jgi:hypothetical protein